ncbi:MAG: phosphatidate cytidylyltransferase [Mariprofundales bacterium]
MNFTMNSELMRRVLTAAVLLPLAIWWLLYSSSLLFFGILLILIAAMVIELLQMLAMPQQTAFGLLAGIAILLALVLNQPIAALVLLLLGSFALFVWSAASSEQLSSEQFSKLLMAQYMLLWLGLFAWSAWMLEAERHILLGVCIGVWAADIIAWFAGRRFGRTKLCRAISPGKTREGALAALWLAPVCAALYWQYMAAWAWDIAYVLGLLLVVSAILGDLNESAIKRVAGVKDSGNILPGHGGLLDRLDAMIVALPVVYVCVSY